MRISYGDQELIYHADGEAPRHRPLTADDADRFRDWAKRYDTMVAANHTDGLLGFGEELHRWLDGDGGWLGPLAGERGTGERRLELATGATPDETGQAFLDVPWELLANGARTFSPATPSGPSSWRAGSARRTSPWSRNTAICS